MDLHLETRLFEIVAVELQVPVAKVGRRVSLRKELGMDSVAAVNIVFAVEEEFGIHVAETELQDVDTVEAILEVLSRESGAVPSGTSLLENGRPKPRRSPDRSV